MLTLWAAVAGAFCGLRVAGHLVLSSLSVEIDNTFAGTQSVLLNGIAITMLLLARGTRSRPMLLTASLVAAIGGLRVFASDLLTLHGLPLVFSVFSFGMLAAVGSVILGRWPRSAPQTSG